MANIIRSTLILAAIAFIASLALSHVNKITYPNILRQEMQKQKNALAVVLPGYAIKEQKKTTIDKKDFIYWIGEKKTAEKDNTGKAVNEKPEKGYAFIAEKPGYSGIVKTMIGIDQMGDILGISILQQSETPGLGARCTEIASKMTFFGMLFGETPTEEEPLVPWFQEQFRGLCIHKKIKILKKGDWNPEMGKELIEKNAVSAITGATITSKTVKTSIETGIQRIKQVIQLKKSVKEEEDATVKEVKQ